MENKRETSENLQEQKKKQVQRLSSSQFFKKSLFWFWIACLFVGVGGGLLSYGMNSLDLWIGLGGFLLILFAVLLLVSTQLQLQGKRLHDLGFSQFWAFLMMLLWPFSLVIFWRIIPMLLLLLCVYSFYFAHIGFAPGNSGSNKYGPDPLNPEMEKKLIQKKNLDIFD